MSIYDFKGKVAIVTGAGSGINHALTELLLEAGCSVVMADLRLRPEAQKTLERHARRGSDSDFPSAVFQRTDMSDWAQIRALWEASLKEYGRVNIVVNGAGVLDPPTSNFWNTPEAVGQYLTFDVNTTGPIRLAQIAVEYWLRHRELEGNLFFFASIAAYLHNMLTPLYFASKAAITSFTKSLGNLREYCGIRVTAICPGTTHSPMLDELQKHITLSPDHIGLTPKECATVAMSLLQEPQYGNGNVVECLKAVNDRGEHSLRVREVPLEKLYPDFDGSDIPIVLGKIEKRFIEKLQ